MLRPQDNDRSGGQRLDGLWDFADRPRWRRAARSGGGSARSRGARPMPVPASYNDVLVDRDVHDHVGDVWYQRSVFVPPGWDGRRIVLRFDAAVHRAVVWVDDEQVGEHEGGYTPFEADLTDARRRRRAAAGHRRGQQRAARGSRIPPGRHPRPPADGRKQFYYHDFYNYAGLLRSVWLCATPRTHIDDVTVVTERDGEHRRRALRGRRSPGTPMRAVRVELRDEAGEVVAEGSGADGELRVADAQLLGAGRRLPLRPPGRRPRRRRRRRPLPASRSASAPCGSTARGS